MKKIMLSMAAIAMVFVACEKEDSLNPSSVQLTEDGTSELPTSFKDITINNKLSGGTGYCFDRTAGPNQHACPSGEGTCLEDVVIEENVAAGLSGAIVNGEVPDFLTPGTISTLSAGSTVIEDELTAVDNGTKKIIEVVMPNSIDSRKAFLIGDFSVTLNANNCDLAIVYEI
jgi:hypothetical protein